ncbi:MAG: cytochrome c [Acidobacteriota bacterium]
MKRFALCMLAAAGMAAAGNKPDASKGNETFDEQCSSCHYADSIDVKVGPGLKWLYSKGTLDANGKPVTDANVLEKIDSGGKTMPAYKTTLSEDDKKNLLAYLKTL